jgi:hypothetical protein
VLSAGALDAGTHRLHWDLRDSAVRRVAPGIYFVRLSAERAAHTRRLTILE